MYVKPVRAAKSRWWRSRSPRFSSSVYLARPAAVGEPWRRVDVLHGGRPGGVVAIVVLRAERLEHEAAVPETVGRLEARRDERRVAHACGMTGKPGEPGRSEVLRVKRASGRAAVPPPSGIWISPCGRATASAGVRVCTLALADRPGAQCAPDAPGCVQMERNPKVDAPTQRARRRQPCRRERRRAARPG